MKKLFLSKSFLTVAILSFALIFSNDSYSQEAGGFRHYINDVINSSPCQITAVGYVDLEFVSDGEMYANASGSITYTFSGQGCPFAGMSFTITFSGRTNTGIQGSNQQSQYYLTNYPELYDITMDIINNL